MNKIDSRFLNFNNVVLGTKNDAPSYPYAGEQYIVGDNPTGDFEDATIGSLAHYDGSRWIFTPPSMNLPYILDVSTGEMKRCYYDTSKKTGGWDAVTGWGEGTTVNVHRTFGDCLVRYVNYVIRSGESLPSTCEKGERFLNTSEKKIYTASDKNTWDDGIDAYLGGYITYRVGSGWRLLYYSVDSLDDTQLYGPCLFIVGCGTVADSYHHTITDDTNDVLLYYYGDSFYQVHPIDTTSLASKVASIMNKTVTESHNLTSDEVGAKEFTLNHSVVSGEEDNVLCFVQGLAQTAGEAFTVSGDTFSWNGKILEGNLNEGDTFIVQYVMASE